MTIGPDNFGESLLDISSAEFFEGLYIIARGREDRLYSDAQVLQLPDIDPFHVLYPEWRVRKRSSAKLVNYLAKRKPYPSILEVGCGNGWLSAKLAGIPHSQVTGIDVNKSELGQARRVFKGRENLSFIEAAWESMPLQNKFDVIVFAASIQYFPSLPATIEGAASLLKKKGEIHVLDTPFYHSNEVAGAKQRSALYYRALGVGPLAAFYHHHSFASLRPFNHAFLFDPSRLANRILIRQHRFPWICITP